MKTHYFKSQNGFTLFLEKLNEKKISGTFKPINPIKDLTFPFYGHSHRICDEHYEVFFNINWNLDANKECFTLFTGNIIRGRQGYLEFNLCWYLHSKLMNLDRTGKCRLTTKTSLLQDKNKADINFPYPKEFLFPQEYINANLNK